MSARPALLAVDFGAESARVCAVTRAGQGLDLRVIHRFPTRTARREGDGALCWDLPFLLEQVEAGLALAAQDPALEPVSIGVDTWGVDFALCPPEGLPQPSRFPVCYRDSRTRGAMESFFTRVARERVHALTGLQFLPFNTLFQLMEELSRQPLDPSSPQRLRFMPDLIHHHLCGATATEFSIATTSQLYNPSRSDWEPELLCALNAPEGLMQPVVPAGTILGVLSESIRRRTGLAALPLVAVATHDTGSAFAGAPVTDPDAAIISSGTWSLIGVEHPTAIITPESLAQNVTNEGAADGGYRVLKNVSGMWLLQQCRRAWWPDTPPSYDDLVSLADHAEPFEALFDPDDPSLLAPDDMPAAICVLVARSGLHAPTTRAEVVRAILESLALKYRAVLEGLRRLMARPITRIHVVGGGCQNARLNQWTADATGCEVIAGPVEATALGNALIQSVAVGWTENLEQAHARYAASMPVEVFTPADCAAWDAAYARFRGLLAPIERG